MGGRPSQGLSERDVCEIDPWDTSTVVRTHPVDEVEADMMRRRTLSRQRKVTNEPRPGRVGVLTTNLDRTSRDVTFSMNTSTRPQTVRLGEQPGDPTATARMARDSLSSAQDTVEPYNCEGLTSITGGRSTRDSSPPPRRYTRASDALGDPTTTAPESTTQADMTPEMSAEKRSTEDWPGHPEGDGKAVGEAVEDSDLVRLSEGVEESDIALLKLGEGAVEGELVTLRLGVNGGEAVLLQEGDARTEDEELSSTEGVGDRVEGREAERLKELDTVGLPVGEAGTLTLVVSTLDVE